MRWPDHPRACGANTVIHKGVRSFDGSSPRVRGKRVQEDRTRPPHRIIPARAGQTMWCRRSARAWSDHPRACGANISLITGMSIRNGSSPRVRGKLQRVVEYVGDGRIIPARAGQTSKVSARHSARSDHPRACGANTSSSRLDLLECGSSPRVRGKRADLRPATAATRIIPARAGQTTERQSA